MGEAAHRGTSDDVGRAAIAPFDAAACTRPAPVLLRYYTIMSLFALVAFPIVWLVHFFKYETLKYRFDDEGILMSWGILFRREINLTYRRIQDIHVTRNIIERWLGLATVSVQTASGSATPEMQIEGILDYEGLRDFLYIKMRGSRGEMTTPSVGGGTAAGSSASVHSEDEALALLHEIRDELARVRGAIETRAGERGEGRR